MVSSIIEPPSRNITRSAMALAKAISQKYSLPESVAVKKLIKHGRLAQTEFIDRPVYMWTANQVTNMITDRDLFETLKETADYIASDFQSLCDPILQQENVTVMVSGDGVEIEGVDKLLAVPLGLIYSYIDAQKVQGRDESSIDMTAYAAHLSGRVNHTNHEEGFTSRLKNMLFNQKNN